jgi:hypothetical protein
VTKFHLHIDAHEASAAFIDKACAQGFQASNFSGHPSGQDRYEPVFHLTRKIDNGRAFREAFIAMRSLAESNPDFDGYIEGEYIAADIRLPEKPFNAHIPIPFRASLTELTPRSFRQSEIHITMTRDSDATLLERLREMGFFGAFLEKPWGSAIVLTMQGTRRMVAQIMPMVQSYLSRAGGASHASLMEERIAAWWTSRPEIRLPPIVSHLSGICDLDSISPISEKE